MPRTLPVPPLGTFEFSSEFLPEEVDYSEAFDFGVDFSFLPEVDFLATSTLGDDEFEYDNVSCDVSFVSYVSFSSDPKRRRQKKRKKRSKIAPIIARVSGRPVGTLIIWPLDMFEN